MAFGTNEYGQTKQENGRASITDKVAEKGAEIAEKAGAQLGSAKASADEVVRNLAERGGEVSGQVKEVAGNMKSAVDKSVKTQPMATLAVAALMGFALGALWKS